MWNTVHTMHAEAFSKVSYPVAFYFAIWHRTDYKLHWNLAEPLGSVAITKTLILIWQVIWVEYITRLYRSPPWSRSSSMTWMIAMHLHHTTLNYGEWLRMNSKAIVHRDIGQFDDRADTVKCSSEKCKSLHLEENSTVPGNWLDE